MSLSGLGTKLAKILGIQIKVQNHELASQGRTEPWVLTTFIHALKN